jgi:Flp pilus assembly protein TadD/glutathione synthase/RimK-type ligase-like ATP-grasp enzyme
MAECQGVGTLNAMTDDFLVTPADVELQLILAPDDAQLLFHRAFALESAGRVDDAKAAYRALLRRHPGHPHALNNLGRLLHAQGAPRAARLTFERLVAAHPNHSAARANLGIILLEADELRAARLHLQRALELDANERLAHLGLSRLLAIEGNDAAALAHQRSALGEAAVHPAAPALRRAPRLLLLTSEAQLGAVAAGRLAGIFAMSAIVVERFDGSAPLPPHHAIFNTITDADRNAEALEIARRIAARSDRPIVNSPDAVLRTSRLSLPDLLGGIPDVVAPRTALLDRAKITDSAGAFGWPVLLRSPGYHSGQHFLMVDEPSALSEALAALPSGELLTIEYADTQSDDGKFRKYRAMFVDGKIYPAHLAISREWKVHFFSADMAAQAEHRIEDAAYLHDVEKALGARALHALAAIGERLSLDYAGIDFALDDQGRVVVFEANSTMTIPAPPPGDLWDYRRAPIKRILDATRNMLLQRARTSGWR